VRIPITLLDPLGFTFYADERGESFFPSADYDVRLVTRLDKLPLATGDALTSVVGIRDFDLVALREAARFVSGNGGVQSERLVALTERLLLPCAELRDELGIAGDGAHAVLLFRDKVPMKQHLQEHGVRVPRFAAFSRPAAEQLLREFGKVAVKPRRQTESIDFNIISHTDDLDSFESRHANLIEDFEVEEYIAGEVFHVDSVVERSRVIVATAGHSPDPSAAHGAQHHFCDIEIRPGRLFDRLMEFNRQVLRCYPDYSGVTHLEVFVTDDEIVFCEIAGRFGGGGIRAGFRARTGIDLAQAMLTAQLGRPMPKPTRFAEDITGYTAVSAPALPMVRPMVLSDPWIVEKQIYAQPGQQVGERLAAVVTVRGHTEDEVCMRLHDAQVAVREAFD
jgi:biotin carboxylase